jgi:hypothetical protein
MSARTLAKARSDHSAAGGAFLKETVKFEPIIEEGVYQGMLVQSPLERVALFSWHRMDLSLSDINRFRRSLVRFRARRAVLYVSADLSIPSAFRLLAALSKIVIVRDEPVAT